MKRGRPTGYKCSQETKDKARKSIKQKYSDPEYIHKIKQGIMEYHHGPKIPKEYIQFSRKMREEGISLEERKKIIFGR